VQLRRVEGGQGFGVPEHDQGRNLEEFRDTVDGDERHPEKGT